MRGLVLCAAGMATLAACAQKPDSIVASYVPDDYYAAMTCEQLDAEAVTVAATLAEANAKQQKAWSNDVVGVALIGVPVSGSSNIAPYISNYKGMLEANARVQKAKNCPARPPAVTAPKTTSGARSTS